MYVIERPTKWEDYLHMVEFAYNNGFQGSAKMIPFEILCGRKCTTHVSWNIHVDHLMVGLEVLQYMEQIVWYVLKNLKVA